MPHKRQLSASCLRTKYESIPRVLPPDLSHLSPALPSDHRITNLRPQQFATSTCIGLSAPRGSGTTFREHGLRILSDSNFVLPSPSL